MAYDLQEQEQTRQPQGLVGQVRQLRVDRGHRGLLAIAAFNGWRWYERSRRPRPRRIYDEMLKAMEAKDAAKVKELAAPGSSRSTAARSTRALAALQAAKVRHEARRPGHGARHNCAG